MPRKSARPSGRSVLTAFGVNATPEFDSADVTPFGRYLTELMDAEQDNCPPLLSRPIDEDLAGKLLRAAGVNLKALARVLRLPRWNYMLVDDLLETEWREQPERNRFPVRRLLTACLYFVAGSLDAEGRPVVTEDRLQPWSPSSPVKAEPVKAWTPPVVSAEEAKSDTRTGGFVAVRTA